MLEKPRFHIQSRHIDKSLQIASEHNSFKNRNLEKIIKDKNPHLYIYIQENSRGKYGQIYKNTAYNTYAHITKFLEDRGIYINFTYEDILIHKRNSQDVFQSIVNYQNGWNPIQPQEDTMFASFIQTLSESIPAIYEQVISECMKTEDKFLRKAYLKGVYDGFMPFYSKLSATIYEELWRFEAQSPPLDEITGEPETLSVEKLNRLWDIPPRRVPYQEAENMDGPDC
ncbi:MAG: hypothetical protein KatS3mg089_0461 [Patescibacteria group bacterium]|nr:MAG: hypothetical protein KatS3mg089_0461 [Patescibacteria group bacterium]